jgi:hypothetical protein
MADDTKAAPFVPLEAKQKPPVVVDPPASPDTVLMIFPVKVNLTVGNQSYVWNPGPRNVPRILGQRRDAAGNSVDIPALDHWYLKAQGVKPYDGSVPMKWGAAKQAEITQKHVEFLRARGYQVDSIESAKSFVATLDPTTVPAFFADAAEWQPVSAEAPVANTLPNDGKPTNDAADLGSMTKAQLVEYAKSKGLELEPTLKKEELFAAIQAHEAPAN